MLTDIQKNNNLFFRQFLFIATLIVSGVIIWMRLESLISCFLGAITIYMVFRPLLIYLTEKKKWKPWFAAIALLFVTIIVLSAAGFLIFEIVSLEIGLLDIDTLIDELENSINKTNGFLGFSLISKNLIVESKGMLANMVSNLLNSTYNITINFFIMLLVLYFMFASGRKMENIILQYFPFKGKCLELIKKETKDMIFGNAVGIPIIMIAQGIISGLGYWIVGFDKFFFFAFLTALFGLVPVVGTATVWIPMSIYLLITGQIWQGVVLLVYGVLLISNADNACRLVLMKKIADTHPLIVIFGVILGIPMFGFWGIIFGPLLISGFLLLIKIYYVEFFQENQCNSVEKSVSTSEDKVISK